MAKARMINRDVAASEKFWDCSEEARVAYLLGIPFTDRDGHLPSSPRKLAGMFLGMSGWSLDRISEVVEELVASGLWERTNNRSVRMSRFHEYQPGVCPGTSRYAKEAESKYSTPTLLPHNSHTTPTLGRPKGREGKGREVEEKRREGAAPILVSTKGDILRAYSEAYEAEFATPCHLKPRDPEAAEKAAELGTFPAGRDLVPAFRAAMRALSDGGYTVSLRSIVNNADLDAKPAKKPKEFGPVYPDLTNLRAEMEAEARKP